MANLTSALPGVGSSARHACVGRACGSPARARARVRAAGQPRARACEQRRPPARRCGCAQGAADATADTSEPDASGIAATVSSPLAALEAARGAFEAGLAAQLATFLDGTNEARFQLQDGSYLIDQASTKAAAEPCAHMPDPGSAGQQAPGE